METSRKRCPELEAQFPGLEIYLTTNSHFPWGYAIPGADRYKITDTSSDYEAKFPEYNDWHQVVGEQTIILQDRAEIVCQHGGTFLLRDFTTNWDIRGTVFDTVEAALTHWFHNRKNNHRDNTS